MLNIEAFNHIDIITEYRSCQDCIYSDMCECDIADLQVCRNYISYDYDIDKEYYWKEMSYNRYTENILKWQYDEYCDDDIE